MCDLFFVPSNGIEWYFKLPLRVPLSPAEISLIGPMVLNGTEWYSVVISGIPLDLFYKGTHWCRPVRQFHVHNVCRR